MGHQGNDLAVLLDDLAVVVDQHQGVVRRLARMLLVPFAGEENTPQTLALRQARENISVSSPGIATAVSIISAGSLHDALQAVLGEHHQVHAG